MTKEITHEIGSEVTVNLATGKLDGIIIEIDANLYFSYCVQTILGSTWVSLDQLEIRQPQKKLGGVE